MLAENMTFLRATHIAARMTSPTDSTVLVGRNAKACILGGSQEVPGTLPTDSFPVSSETLQLSGGTWLWDPWVLYHSLAL